NEDETLWPSSDRLDDYPTQARRVSQQVLPIRIASEVPKYTVIDAHLKIFKLTLPRHYLPLLGFILQGCIGHAEKSSCGWMTYLYSLTKQDIALRDVQGLYEASKPIIFFIKSAIERLYGVDTVRIDRNQPHVLKYEDDHRAPSWAPCPQRRQHHERLTVLDDHVRAHRAVDVNKVAVIIDYVVRVESVVKSSLRLRFRNNTATKRCPLLAPTRSRCWVESMFRCLRVSMFLKEKPKSLESFVED
ncbi:hypothetical protein THAOC_07946, partial [Thalassiosira oceanica]